MVKAISKLIAVLIFSTSMGASATISVDWTTYGTIYLNDGTTPLPIGSIAQLIWSPDPTISEFSPTDALIPDSSEVLLLQIATTDPGAIYYGVTSFIESDYGLSDTNYFADGYVYMRVFDYLLTNGTPTPGTQYGEGPNPTVTGSVPSQHTAIPPLPTTVDITDGNYFIIPEPASMAIMGVGLLTLTARRFRRRAGCNGPAP